MRCEPESLSHKAMDLARLDHWTGKACLHGKAFEMVKLLASLLKPAWLSFLHGEALAWRSY